MKPEKINNNYSDDVRLALLEQAISNINNTLIRFEKRFDQIDAQFDKIDDKFEKIRSESLSHHKWTLGLISGLYLIVTSSLITVLIKYIHP